MMFEHLPSHDIRLVLKCLGHVGMGIVLQQDGAFSEFTHRAENPTNVMQQKVLEHPAYSLDLSQCHIHIYGSL
jgi:hypothetical protein